MGQGKKGGSPALLVGIIGAVIFMIVLNQCPKAGQSGNSGSGGQASAGATAQASGQGSGGRPFSGAGYILKFGTDFNPGANAVDDIGISVLIAVDVSGSMADPPASGGQAKYIQAGRALSEIISFLEGMSKDGSMAGMKFKVGLISFSDGLKVLSPLREMDGPAFAALRAGLNDPASLKPLGRTAIGSAIELGAEMLAGSGTVMKSMIIVSDGENTSGPEPAEVLWALNENRNSASRVDFPVYTRGTLVSFVGFDIDSGLFGGLAQEGARLTQAANQAELKRALTDILVADISKLEAAQ